MNHSCLTAFHNLQVYIESILELSHLHELHVGSPRFPLNPHLWASQDGRALQNLS
jgi:hypothetical protein